MKYDGEEMGGVGNTSNGCRRRDEGRFLSLCAVSTLSFYKMGNICPSAGPFPYQKESSEAFVCLDTGGGGGVVVVVEIKRVLWPRK